MGEVKLSFSRKEWVCPSAPCWRRKGYVPETEEWPVWERKRKWLEDTREAGRDCAMKGSASQFKGAVLYLKPNGK